MVENSTPARAGLPPSITKLTNTPPLLFSTRTGSPWQDGNLRRSFRRGTDMLDIGINVTEFAKIEFTPHMARRSAATAVYHHESGGKAAAIAHLGHQNASQLLAYVADLGLEPPDFTAVAALDQLLPILDQTLDYS